MFNVEIIAGLRRRSLLEIIWRNPNPVQTRPRRRNLEYAPKCTRCTLQEFVDDGYIGHWTTIADLEILAGGRAA